MPCFVKFNSSFIKTTISQISYFICVFFKKIINSSYSTSSRFFYSICVIFKKIINISNSNANIRKCNIRRCNIRKCNINITFKFCKIYFKIICNFSKSTITYFYFSYIFIKKINNINIFNIISHLIVA